MSDKGRGQDPVSVCAGHDPNCGPHGIRDWRLKCNTQGMEPLPNMSAVCLVNGLGHSRYPNALVKTQRIATLSKRVACLSHCGSQT